MNIFIISKEENARVWENLPVSKGYSFLEQVVEVQGSEKFLLVLSEVAERYEVRNTLEENKLLLELAIFPSEEGQLLSEILESAKEDYLVK